jgi:hypothetical protein
MNKPLDPIDILSKSQRNCDGLGVLILTKSILYLQYGEEIYIRAYRRDLHNGPHFMDRSSVDICFEVSERPNMFQGYAVRNGQII